MDNSEATSKVDDRIRVLGVLASAMAGFAGVLMVAIVARVMAPPVVREMQHHATPTHTSLSSPQHAASGVVGTTQEDPP